MPKKLLNDCQWDNNDEPHEKLIPILSNPSYLPILLTAIFYIIIAGYYVSFFNRLSLPYYSLNLPLTFYFHAGYYFLFYASIFAFFIFSIYSGLIFLKSIRAKGFSYFGYVTSITSVLFLFLFIYWIFSFFSLNTLYIFSLLCIGLTALFIGKNHYNKSYPDKIFKNLWVGILILCLLVFLSSIPPIAGKLGAESLIKGEGDYVEVKLHLKDENITIPNSTLILIIQANGNYYLTEKTDLVPKFVKLYVIPEEQIEMISTEFHTGNSIKLDSIIYSIINLNNLSLPHPLKSLFSSYLDLSFQPLSTGPLKK
jgi:hypothetical protein